MDNYINKVIQGDCLIKLKELEDNSVDSIVTDPPAGISFMGKSWDTDKGGRDNWIKWMQEVATECKRVLKPGGHAFVWAIPRTSHWTATAWENAGFEIRDVVAHVFGSGFPKSLNIGKAVDKLQGNEREVTGSYKVPDIKGDAYGTMNEKQGGSYKNIEVNKTKGTSEWEGWGTALKPAREDWILMRKPLDKGLTIAENCLKWGTGGINIDESRVGTGAKKWSEPKGGIWSESVDNGAKLEDNPLGRFPANLIHDNSEEVRECFPETKSGTLKPYKQAVSNANVDYAVVGEFRDVNREGDSGNASRFFKGIPQVVDLYDFSIYNRSILTNIKQLCGQHLTKKKTDITLDGVIQEVEKFIQDAELLMSGNSTTIEKFLTDTASITKTLIAQMTELKTLNVLPNWLITKFTEESEQTIKSLRELTTEDVKSAKSIFLLQTFTSEVLESIRDIVKIVVEQDSNSGEYKSLIYQAKASKSERNKGCDGLEEGEVIRQGLAGEHNNPTHKNNHPTVKPIALMEYLIKMVTPKGGIVLDPFAGSGSTLVAAKQNGYKYIGIEMTEEYIPIIEARLLGVENDLFKDTL